MSWEEGGWREEGGRRGEGGRNEGREKRKLGRKGEEVCERKGERREREEEEVGVRGGGREGIEGGERGVRRRVIDPFALLVQD